MSAEHDSVSGLVLRLMVTKLCARIHTRVAAIDLEKQVFKGAGRVYF